MEIDYIITGEFEQISQIMLPIMKEKRFLSDKPNVNGFTWYPVSSQIQAVELDLVSRPTDEEVTFLASEYSSLTFGVFENGELNRLIGEEGVEVL